MDVREMRTVLSGQVEEGRISHSRCEYGQRSAKRKRKPYQHRASRLKHIAKITRENKN